MPFMYCIATLRPATAEDLDKVSFQNDPTDNRCWSYVGRQEGTQKVQLSDYCSSHKVILHQFMHSIGFYHEHVRPDRDNYVKIHPNCIRNGGNQNFKIQPTSLTFGLPYDAKTVMHYTSTDFSNSKNCKTITSVVMTFHSTNYAKSYLMLHFQTNI